MNTQKYNHEYYLQHKEIMNERSKAYGKKHPWMHQKWQHEHREQVALVRLKSLYGVTPEQYKKLLEEQKGVCAICGKAPNKRRLYVDHDHVTGRIRGLLCPACNQQLPLIEDKDRLRASIAYLSKYR